jgi:hypothetical protein
MTSDEDPEARIRELERSLNDQARASELGGGRVGGTAYPPPVSGYSQPAYGTQPYTAQHYGSGVPAPRRRSSGGISWRVFAIIAVVIVSIAIAIVKVSSLSGHGSGGIIHVPSIPSMPSVPAAPNAPAVPNAPVAPAPPGPDSDVITASPDTPASVSGIDNTKAITCTDGTVNVSGIRNHVNITGHCVSVSVSGIDNQVSIDATDAIDCFGSGNSVSYRTGEPQVNTGGSNSVFQGG